MTMATTQDLTTGGTVRPITRWGTPVIHRPTRPVTDFGDELHTLVRDMFATMVAAEGAGLAATQVGVDLAVFVFDCADGDDVRYAGAICNPVVELPEGSDRRLELSDEGCLSFPGAYIGLARPDYTICRGIDAYGAPVEVIGDGGTLARCLQHETDHLNGIVFGDRLPGRTRKKLGRQHHQLAPNYPDDWPVSPRLNRDDADADDTADDAAGAHAPSV